jgi:gamma-glutamyl phosphate reductase
VRAAANAEDVAAAKAAGTADALLARLYLTPAKLAQLAGALCNAFSPLF